MDVVLSRFEPQGGPQIVREDTQRLTPVEGLRRRLDRGADIEEQGGSIMGSVAKFS